MRKMPMAGGCGPLRCVIIKESIIFVLWQMIPERLICFALKTFRGLGQEVR